MKKKVGICACYDTLNYGSMLQSFATQVAIDSMGYSSEYIVYKKKKTPAFIIKQLPRFLNSNLIFDKIMKIKKKNALGKYPEIESKNKTREKAFKRFQDKYYRKFSPVYFGYDELCKAANSYDSILVGSDQLWTPGGLGTNFYNLMFVPDEVNKISYATSFGVSSIPWYQRNRTKNYLRRINYLSVREIKGANLVNEIAGCPAKVVVDPTMLLTKQRWQDYIPEKRIVEEPYIFCYFLGENPGHRNIAKELKEKTGLPIVCTPFLDSFVEGDLQFGEYQLFDIGPDDFINLIRGAEYVLTDSFHGSVFSILHHKKFVTLNRFDEGKQSRNSRIDSLCAILGLEDRRYRSNILEEISSDIDYTAVDEKLMSLREESLEFMNEALNQVI